MATAAPPLVGTPPSSFTACYCRRRSAGSGTQRDVERLLLAAALDRDLHGGTCRLFADGRCQLVRFADGEVVELGDDITSLDAGFSCRRAAVNGGHLGAHGELGSDRACRGLGLDTDAELAVGGLIGVEDFLGHPLGV